MPYRPGIAQQSQAVDPHMKMDTSNVLSLLEQLDDEIDDLEGSLAPLLKAAISQTTSKFPLLDKAKLYVLVTYAIESMLFSYLRLNGVKAREHPVFTELTRVRQYFNKIKVAEAPAEKKEGVNINKQAAARFIKAGLAGNDKYDLQRAEQQAKERARSHIKFEELSKKRKIDHLEKPIDRDSSESDSDSELSAGETEEPPVAPITSRSNWKVDKLMTQCAAGEPVPNSGVSSASEGSRKKRNKSKKRLKKDGKVHERL